MLTDTLPSASDLRATERRWEQPTTPPTHLVLKVDSNTGHLLHATPAWSDAEALGITAGWGPARTGVHYRIDARDQAEPGTRIGHQGETQPEACGVRCRHTSDDGYPCNAACALDPGHAGDHRGQSASGYAHGWAPTSTGGA